MKKTRRILALAGATLLSACNPSVPDSRVVAPWIRVPYDLADSAGLSSLHAARASAYLAIAMHEAWVPDRKSGLSSLGGQLNGFWSAPAAPLDGVDGAIAAAQAARIVMDSLYGGAARRADSLASLQIAQRGRERVRREVADSSLEFGRRVAGAVLAWARMDNAARTFVARNGDECASPAVISTRSAGSAGVKRSAPDSSVSRRWADMLADAIDRRPRTAGEAMQAWVRTSIAAYDAGITARRQAQRDGGSAPLGASAVANAAAPILMAALGDSADLISTARDELAQDTLALGRAYASAVQRGSDVGRCVGERVLGRLNAQK